MSPEYAPFEARRRRLLSAMGEGVLVLAAGAEVSRNRDTHYPFRSDSYFHYLTGFPEPDAVLVLVAGAEPRQILFCRDKDLEREIWDGYRFGPEAARTVFGFDDSHALCRLDEILPSLLENQSALHYLLGEDSAWDKRVMAWLNSVRVKARSGVSAPGSLIDARALLDEMRLIKAEDELDKMRRAAAISVDAHRRAWRATRPGRYEYEIEAELLHAFRQGGAESPAYPSIVAGGAHACILHYIGNDQRLNDGDLLLIDAGAEFAGYAADITRTYPVNGRFSAAQKAVYEIVLAAQAAAMQQIVPGHRWNEGHDAAVRVLTRGMVDLGLLHGEVDGLIEQNAYKTYYMHRTGHWLGRDVHDAGEYKLAGDWRPLQPGMTLTVEPGMYIRPAPDVPEAFWNIGIRIEDDVHVTATGCEVLTEALPRSVAGIEEAMRHD
jgi:Xaa-Pro aminopeptidase